MQITSEALERAIEELAKLPGTGRKSARRIAMHLLKQSDEEVFRLTEALEELKRSVIRCSECGTITDTDPCRICSNPRRESHQICVVEEFQDVYFIEKTNEFRGRYHVLGGVISPMQNVGHDQLRLVGGDSCVLLPCSLERIDGCKDRGAKVILVQQIGPLARVDGRDTGMLHTIIAGFGNAAEIVFKLAGHSPQ